MSFTVRDTFLRWEYWIWMMFFLIGPRLSYEVCILGQTWSLFALIMTKSASKSPNSTVRSKVRYFCWWHINLKRYISGLYKQCIYYIYMIIYWTEILCLQNSYSYYRILEARATFQHVNDGSTQKHLEKLQGVDVCSLWSAHSWTHVSWLAVVLNATFEWNKNLEYERS